MKLSRMFDNMPHIYAVRQEKNQDYNDYSFGGTTKNSPRRKNRHGRYRNSSRSSMDGNQGIRSNSMDLDTDDLGIIQENANYR